MNLGIKSMSKYPIHEDFKKYENFKVSMSPKFLAFANWLLKIYSNHMKLKPGIKSKSLKIKGYKNELIDVKIFEPENIGANAPCLIYFHGGAFAMRSAPFHTNLICEYAFGASCKVVFVDYRLANKFPFPVGLEDCYSAFAWVQENAETLGIDLDRIALGGDSAGGGLALGISLLARDRKAGKICFQLLVYPVTDSRMITDSMKNFTDTPIWNSILTKKMWDMYLKDGLGDYKKEYISPIETESLKELPDTYIEVAQFDCLRDEGIEFAKALVKSGVKVELFETIGTIHGFEIAEKSEVVKESVYRRIDALKRNFYKEEAK